VLDSNRTDEVSMQNTKTISRTEPAVYGLGARWPALLTICLGLVMLYFVGFSTFPQTHNSAHDTRHANGFPCH
jgi:cobalt transporter subunit CbtB